MGNKQGGEAQNQTPNQSQGSNLQQSVQQQQPDNIQKEIDDFVFDENMDYEKEFKKLNADMQELQTKLAEIEKKNNELGKELAQFQSADQEKLVH
ncbi:hypothetical protein pb186bvf_015769 [Paramecium bursaria]